MSIPSEALPPRGRPYMAWAGGLCLVCFVALSAALGILYARAARYQPRIPPPQPSPSPNAISDYMVAGWMLEASGGTRSVFGGYFSPAPVTIANERALVARNRPALRQLRIGL